jgi:hypothetical protein
MNAAWQITSYRLDPFEGFKSNELAAIPLFETVQIPSGAENGERMTERRFDFIPL